MPPWPISAFGYLSNLFREEVMRETGGAVAVGGRDAPADFTSAKSRGQTRVFNWTSVREPDCYHRDGRAYIWALPEDERGHYCANCASTTAADGRGCAMASNAPAKRGKTRFRDLGR